jgi:hypothetical protein
MTSEAISVIVRIRPFLIHELGEKTCIDVESNSCVKLVLPPQNSVVTHTTLFTFHFSSVFSEETTQEELFQKSNIINILDSVILEGYSASIFAYGQTGTGKTYTITGPEVGENSEIYRISGLPTDGILPRSVSYIYDTIDKHPEVKFTVQVSFLEIYNEKVWVVFLYVTFLLRYLTYRMGLVKIMNKCGLCFCMLLFY